MGPVVVEPVIAGTVGVEPVIVGPVVVEPVNVVIPTKAVQYYHTLAIDGPAGLSLGLPAAGWPSATIYSYPSTCFNGI